MESIIGIAEIVVVAAILVVPGALIANWLYGKFKG